MLTMKRSRLAMKTATETTRRTFQRRSSAIRWLHFATVADAVAFCNHAPPPVRRPELLHRRRPRRRRRALDAPGHARGPPRPAPLRRHQAQHGRRAEHPQRPAGRRSSTTACSSAAARSTCRRARASTSTRSSSRSCSGATGTSFDEAPRVLVHTDVRPRRRPVAPLRRTAARRSSRGRCGSAPARARLPLSSQSRCCRSARPNCSARNWVRGVRGARDRTVCRIVRIATRS